MGILDDAIREHLDLKRRHGARDTELREIEDEAFGQGDQPDPFVGGELYTEVGAGEAADAGNEEPTRLVDAEALRPTEPEPEPEALPPSEPPPVPEPEALRPSEPEPETSDQPLGGEPDDRIPGQVELPGQDEIPGQERLDAEPEARPPADEPEGFQPAREISAEPPETSEEPQAPEPPSTSESLEELIAEEEPFPEDSAAPPPAPAPPEAEAEPEPEARPLEPEPDAQAQREPEVSVPDPPPPPPDSGSEPPGRARGRVDVPTQEHPPPGDTGDLPPLPVDEPELGRPDTTYEPPPMEPPSDEEPLPVEPPSDEASLPAEPPSDEAPLPDEDTSGGSDGPQLYDFETDEDTVPPPAPGSSAVDDDFEALGPAEEGAPYLDEEEPYAEEPASGAESGGEAPYEEPGTEVRPAIEDEEPDERRPSETRERAEEEGEEEDLWFEKGPPKDFDFDD
jgi:hypothetical protein